MLAITRALYLTLASLSRILARPAPDPAAVSIPPGAVVHSSGTVIEIEVIATIVTTTIEIITASAGESAPTPTSASSTDIVDAAELFQENSASAAFTIYTGVTTPTGNVVVVVETASAMDASASAWVAAHNAARAEYGADPVGWDDALVDKAQANAQLCTGAHTNAGENIADQSGSLTPQQSVDMWMAENIYYNWTDPVYSDAAGHFTQVVWKASQYIGCYIQECAPGTLFNTTYGTSYQATCEYDPVGNVANAGEFAANVGVKVS